MLVQTSRPLPLSPHDYIAGHGLGFCKPLAGEASRTPNPFPFDSPCHVTGSLVPLVPFICSLSSSQSSESKWMSRTWWIRESRIKSIIRKTVEIYRPQRWSPWTLKGPREHSQTTGTGRWSSFIGENGTWFYDLDYFVYCVFPLWTSGSFWDTYILPVLQDGESVIK